MTSAAAYLQVLLEVPRADPELDLEATARVAEVLLVAAQLHRQAGLSHERAEALLATYRAKIAMWQAWAASHVDATPDMVADLHVLLLARVAALRRDRQGTNYATVAAGASEGGTGQVRIANAT
jgi:hypothetical protein